jgi:hypothetical protein
MTTRYRFETLVPVEQSVHWYYLAQKLARSGKVDQAIPFWQKSRDVFQGQPHFSTLAGWQLSKQSRYQRDQEP